MYIPTYIFLAKKCKISSNINATKNYLNICQSDLFIALSLSLFTFNASGRRNTCMQRALCSISSLPLY